MEQPIFYTIGHGEREVDEFLELLLANEITILIDVRANPLNQTRYHFEEPQLRNELESVDIIYHWAGKQLGEKREGLIESPHFALQDQHLRAYADYMMTPLFEQTVIQLLNLGRRGQCVIMGNAVSPECCHRSLIADYLTLQWVTVLDIVDGNTTIEHFLRPEARKESAALIYDRVTEADHIDS